MSGVTLATMIAGLACFGLGAFLSATGEKNTGIVLMGLGLVFQVLTLRQMRLARIARASAGQAADAKSEGEGL